MNRIELKINDDKTQTVVTPQVLVEGENLTTEISVEIPASWAGSAIRALITTPKGVLVDAVDASVPVPLTNTMLDGKGTLYVEYVAMNGGTEIARTKSPALLPVSAARSIIGDIDPAPLPDLVAEMVAAKNTALSAASSCAATDAAVQAAEAIRVSAEQGRGTAEGLRASAESTRGTNETGRVNAELLRVTAEGGRVTAESGRVTAESARSAFYAGYNAELQSLGSQLEQISYVTSPSSVDFMTVENESYLSNNNLIRTYNIDGTIGLSFTETSNPQIAWWLKGLIPNKQYRLSFELISGAISVEGNQRVYSYSAGGEGAAMIASSVRNGSIYTITFTSSVASYYHPDIFKLSLVYSSKSVTIGSVSVTETATSKQYIRADALQDDCIKMCVTSAGAITGYSGQCISLKFPNGKNMLMDTHSGDNYISTANTLGFADAYKVDYLMITHYHGDHVGGLLNWITQGYLDSGYIQIDGATVFLPPLIDTGNIAAVAASGDVPATLVASQDAIISALASHGCTIVHPDDGDEYEIGEAKIRFWNCNHGAYSVGGSAESTNYNDFSLCADVIYGTQVFTNAGDLGSIGQAYQAGKICKSTILSAPHHGWDGSENGLNPLFINSANPNIVISSNGREHYPTSIHQANIMNASSSMQTWCERNNVSNYCSCFNGIIRINLYKYDWVFDYSKRNEGDAANRNYLGGIAYVKFIRNNKNWKYTDNSEFVET